MFPRPRRRRIVQIYAQDLVRPRNRVVYSVIPTLASRAELLGRIPQYVGNRRLPTQSIVAPAKEAVALAPVEATIMEPLRL